MKLNQSELKSFFYGTLLGDSYIHNGTFACKQITKNLVYFKAGIIKKYLPDAKVFVNEFDGYTDKNGVCHQKYYQLNVSGSEYIKKLNDLFYPKGVKIYPMGVIKHLTPLGFAMWYADDGTTILVGKNETTSSSKSRRVQFCTDGFTKEDNLIIQKEMIELNFNCKIIDRCRNNQVRIEISPKDGQKLFCKIEKYFYYFPEMLYKLDMGYRLKSLDNKTYVNEEYKNLFFKISAHPQFIDRMIGR